MLWSSVDLVKVSCLDEWPFCLQISLLAHTLQVARLICLPWVYFIKYLTQQLSVSRVVFLWLKFFVGLRYGPVLEYQISNGGTKVGPDDLDRPPPIKWKTFFKVYMTQNFFSAYSDQWWRHHWSNLHITKMSISLKQKRYFEKKNAILLYVKRPFK